MSPMIITLLLAGITLAVLAVVMTIVLGWSNRAFHVDVDPKVQAIEDALPGANCGGCGYVGCAEYAVAVARGEAPPDLCAPGGPGCAARLAELMGLELDASFPKRAVVHCRAETDDKLLCHPYHGEPTCRAASLVVGIQGCTYGCLGLGDCREACNYGAIEIVNGLARIHVDKCVGCGACVKACPRNIIEMIPFKADEMLVLGCANQDGAKEVKAVCKVGCIGCTACARVNKDLLDMDGKLPVFNYDNYDPETSQEDLDAICEKCNKQHCFVTVRRSAADA